MVKRAFFSYTEADKTHTHPHTNRQNCKYLTRNVSAQESKKMMKCRKGLYSTSTANIELLVINKEIKLLIMVL